MVNNTLLGFKLQKNIDFVDVTKTFDNTISFEVYFHTSCRNKILLVKETLVAPTARFRIPLRDGKYVIRIYSIHSTTLIKTYKEYEFVSYNILLDSITSDISKRLCNCEDPGCIGDGCKEINKKEIELKDALITKMMSFFILTSRYSNTYLNKSLDCIECDIYNMIPKITQEKLTCGKEDLNKMMSKLISVMYYSIYLWYKNHQGIEETTVNKKFKIDVLMPCLEESISQEYTKCIVTSVYADPNFSIDNNEFKEL